MDGYREWAVTPFAVFFCPGFLHETGPRAAFLVRGKARCGPLFSANAYIEPPQPACMNIFLRTVRDALPLFALNEPQRKNDRRSAVPR
jgi:hypothetical protein